MVRRPTTGTLDFRNEVGDTLTFMCTGNALGVELKKAAKLFANKFATGGSVSKNNQG
jgi:translation initiation factor 1 (eIF-1/SUI1)